MVEAGSFALNANKGKKERIGRLLQMHANSREDVKIARAGDIVAIAGLKDVITGETLCDEKAPIVLERMEFPGTALGPSVSRSWLEGSVWYPETLVLQLLPLMSLRMYPG